MATQTIANRIRLGILALPLSTAVVLVGIFLPGSLVDPAVDLGGYAEQISSTSYALYNILVGISALLGIFGFFSLYAYLANGRAERWAFAAMLLSVVGVAGGLSVVGIGSVESVAGEMYLEGQQAFLEEWLDSPFTLQDVFLIIINRVLFLIGLLLFTVAVWRSGTLPRGAAILWVAAAVLFPIGAPLGIVGQAVFFVLLTVANSWIAWTIWRQPNAEMVGVEAQPQVR